MPYDDYNMLYGDMYGWYRNDRYGDKYMDYYEKVDTSSAESVIRRYGDDFSTICDRLSRNDLLNFISFCNSNNVRIDGDKNYLIRWAAHYSKLDILELALDNPTADPSADNNYAILKCIELKNNSFAIKMLKDNRVDINSNYNNIVIHAIKDRNYQVVDYIINHPNFDINIGIEDIIKVSCQVGNVNVLKMVLEHDRISFKRSLSVGFISACRYNQSEIMDILMKSENIDISYDNNNSFLNCFSNQKYDLCKRIVDDNRFDPSKGNYVVVETMIRYKNYEILEKILKHKNILVGNVNILITKMLSSHDYLKKFIIDNRVISLISNDVKNELIKNKLIPFYKGKQIERTL